MQFNMGYQSCWEEEHDPSDPRQTSLCLTEANQSHHFMPSRHSFQSERNLSSGRTPWVETSPVSWTMSPMTFESPFTQYKLQKHTQECRTDYRCIATVSTEDGHISAVAATNEVLYSGSNSRKIRVWKLPEFQECSRFKSGGGSVKALVVEGDKVYSANQDQKIRVFRRSTSHSSRHRLVAALPTKKDRLTNSIFPESYIQVRRHHKSLWINHVDAISSLALNPQQGLLYSGSWDKTVKVWRLPDFKCSESICAHDDAVNTVVVGSNGLLFTGSADGTVKVWENVKGEAKHVQIALLQETKNFAVNALALGSDGAILYAGFSNGTISYWKKAQGDSIAKAYSYHNSLRGHSRSVLCLTTRDSVVFSGSADRTIRAWRNQGKDHLCIAVLRGHDSPVKCITSLSFPTMEKKTGSVVVYSGSLDGTIKAWWVSIHEKANSDDNLFHSEEEEYG